MKVVINTCYGGFGLSGEALVRLIEIGSELIEKERASEWSTKGISEGNGKWIAGGYQEYMHSVHKDGFMYGVDDWDKSIRTHPDIIRVIEELGSAANSDYASLSIVDVPDGVGWRIEEYDGNEWVSENHRTWR